MRDILDEFEQQRTKPKYREVPVRTGMVVEDRATGFCYLNNTAIAAQRLRSQFGKVAILDVDAHHGDGTQQIFYRRDDVLTISVHADPTNYYPFFTGYADERGEFLAGDYAVYEPGSVHGPDTLDGDPCWTLFRLDGKVRFGGWRGALQRIFG